MGVQSVTRPLFPTTIVCFVNHRHRFYSSVILMYRFCMRWRHTAILLNHGHLMTLGPKSRILPPLPISKLPTSQTLLCFWGKITTVKKVISSFCDTNILGIARWSIVTVRHVVLKLDVWYKSHHDVSIIWIGLIIGARILWVEHSSSNSNRFSQSKVRGMGDF